MIDPICESCDGFMRLGDTGKTMVCTSCGEIVLRQDPIGFIYELLKNTDYSLHFALRKSFGIEITMTKGSKFITKLFEYNEAGRYKGDYLGHKLVEMKNELAKHICDA